MDRRKFLAALAVAAAFATSVAAQDDPPPALSFEAGSETLAFTPEDIWAVTVHSGLQPGGVNLEIMLSSDGKARFARFTAIHVGQPLAVFVGGEFLFEPTLQAPITGGRVALGFPDQPSAAAAMDVLQGR